MLVTVTRDIHYVYAIILAWATLGGMTEIGSFLFLLCCPRWPRQVSSDCRVLLSHAAVSGIIMLTFANGNMETWLNCQRPVFVDQNLTLSSSFRCDQIYHCHRYDFGHTFVLVKSELDVQQTHLRYLKCKLILENKQGITIMVPQISTVFLFSVHLWLTLKVYLHVRFQIKLVDLRKQKYCLFIEPMELMRNRTYV